MFVTLAGAVGLPIQSWQVWAADARNACWNDIVMLAGAVGLIMPARDACWGNGRTNACWKATNASWQSLGG